MGCFPCKNCNNQTTSTTTNVPTTLCPDYNYCEEFLLGNCIVITKELASCYGLDVNTTLNDLIKILSYKFSCKPLPTTTTSTTTQSIITTTSTTTKCICPTTTSTTTNPTTTSTSTILPTTSTSSTTTLVPTTTSTTTNAPTTTTTILPTTTTSTILPTSTSTTTVTPTTSTTTELPTTTSSTTELPTTTSTTTEMPTTTSTTTLPTTTTSTTETPTTTTSTTTQSYNFVTISSSGGTQGSCSSTPSMGDCCGNEYTADDQLFMYFINSSGMAVVPDVSVIVTVHYNDGSFEDICIPAFQAPVDNTKKCYYGAVIKNFCNNCTIEAGPSFVEYTYVLGTC